VNPIRSLTLILLLVLHTNAFAEADEPWKFSVAPYLWVTGQEGQVATLPSTPPIDLDISFGDIIENLDMTLMGIVEARKNRFGLFSEIFYVGISVDADVPSDLYSDADYEQDLWGISLGGSFALTQDANHYLNAVAGIRFWDLDNTIKFRGGLLPAQKVSEQESWSDFFVGLKGRKDLNDRWLLNGWAIVAVAGDSDSSFDLFGGVGYKFSDTFSLDVGYRHHEIEYENRGFLYDVEMSGPIVGLVFQL
jgi:hypothetical protein